MRRIVFSRLNDDSESAQRFKTFEQRSPSLCVYLGLRRDCGSTLTHVGGPRPVSTGELQEFVVEGAINNFPTPDVEKDNVNYLAGIREIGVRSEYTDGRDMPRGGRKGKERGRNSFPERVSKRAASPFFPPARKTIGGNKRPIEKSRNTSNNPWKR